ncbi:unnamed protein product [Triticum turgidum subsp. durum]|uniref:Glycosyltransferase 61 catalytic domain-containing protein n=1 Tax=Triticum turgidum subsp. durum TaxID=4567 RepID=A0A9R1AWZ8_TRITD|nr:unnamed protein product [Triticum turgidum subsp. durum]
MKAALRSRQEPRRVSNGVIIAAMLLSLCVLSIVKARYCSTPFGKPDDQLKEQMNSSIRMETDDEPTPAATTVGVSEEDAEEDVEEDSAARGFSGNLYHDYTDVLVPLFLSTRRFNGEVQFLLSDLKPWWVAKFRPLFRQLSKYEVVDVNNDLEVHCLPRIVVGSDFHKDMGIVPSKAGGGVSIVDFKRTLRDAFGLERAAASRGGATGAGKPRLLIISRKNSRRFLNEREMAAAATAMGFDVRIAEPDQHTDMSTFARLVNSADVMVGVHGAGLTNMVFLPAGAVLIQVVPFGGLEWLTGVTFKNPAADMEVTYMDYNVQLEESSLLEQYPRNHQVLTDPYAVHKQGWDALKAAYLDKQNVRLDLDKFRATLRDALSRLPPASTPAA